MKAILWIIIFFPALILNLKINAQSAIGNNSEFLERLYISDNNRYLVSESNVPVYLLGGTAWTLPENSTREDVDYYLNDRKDKGFNYVQVVAARDLNIHSIRETIKLGTMNPENKYGYRPFEFNVNGKADVIRPIIMEGGSPTSPNDYWDHLDYIVQKAMDMGLYLGLLPTWGRYYVNNKDPEMRIFNEITAKSYGKFLGNRYKDYKHIIWILGGDILPTKFWDARQVYRSMAEGIAEGVTGETPEWDKAHPVWDRVIITYHGREASAEHFNDDEWLKLNMIYLDDPELYQNVSKYYSNFPKRPMIKGESWYEGWVWNGEYKSAKVIRRQMYHTFLGGALGGYVYGVASSVKGKEDQLLKFQPGWRDKLNLEGANQVRHLKELLNQHNWWKWIPDQSIITRGIGSGEALKVACMANDKTEILVYFADNTSAIIDLKKLSEFNYVTAKWFDPRNGDYVNVGIFPTNRNLNFSPPKNWDDAVLIVEKER